MKKLIFWLVVSLLSPTLAFATVYVEKSSDGKFRFTDDTATWQKSAVVVHPEVLQYVGPHYSSGRLEDALRKPGVVVPIQKRYTKIEAVGILRAKETVIVPLGFLATPTELKLVHDAVVSEKEVYSFFYLAWVLTFMFALLASWQRITGHQLWRHDLSSYCVGIATVIHLAGTFLSSIENGGWTPWAMTWAFFGLMFMVMFEKQPKLALGLYITGAIAQVILFST